ncbi:MAG: hypothetical protein HZB41_12795 [Ignavibacteriae bacterium]|nr:hypothetical protein [Ignavibacteriota bacterium]
MADYLGIAEGEGIKPLNPQERKDKDFFRKPAAKNKKEVQLRVGEVIQSTILDIVSSQEAIVQLPTGTVSAFIHGRLKKGDVVFLRVNEISPDLILRIHSVSYIKNGLELPLSEITRILDLPGTQFFIETVQFLKKRKSYILRDEALIIENAFISIDESIRKDYNSEVLFSAIIFMHENKLPVDSRIVMKIAPVLSGNNYILNLLISLENSVPQLPEQIRYKAESFFKLIKSNSTSINKLINALLIESTDNEAKSLYETLVEILLIKDEKIEREIKKVKEISRKIIQVIEGQHFLNTFGLNNNSALYFYLPFPYQNLYSIAKVIIRGQPVSKQTGKRIIKFSIISNTLGLGEIVSSGELTLNSLNLNIITSSGDLSNLFIKHINSLKEKLSLQNKNVQSIVVEDVKGVNTSEFESGRQSPTNFSIVV